MGLVPEYLCYYLNSFARKQIEEGKVGMALTHFNTKSVAQLAIPVPPLEEQKRIVAKVDQLMDLCDELEAKLNQAQQHSEKLMEATVRQLLGTSAPQKPHTARAAVVSASSKPVRQPCHANQTVSAATVRTAVETVVDYASGSIPGLILSAMRQNKEYSRADILAATGIGEADWMWAIRQLKEQGRVVQKGEKRGARYRLA